MLEHSKKCGKKTLGILFIAPDTNVLGTRGDSIHLRELLIRFMKIKNLSLVALMQCNNFRKCIEKHELFDNFQQSNLQLWCIRKIKIRPLGFFTAAAALILLLKKLKFISRNIDILYVRNHLINIGPIVLKILFPNKILIVEANTIIHYDAWLSKAPSILLGFILVLEKLLYKLSDAIISVSSGIRKIIAEIFKINKTIYLIPNGANTKVFRIIPNARKELCLPDKERYVLFVGALDKWYNFDLLIESFKKLVYEYGYNNVKLIITGDGPLREMIERKIMLMGLEEKVLLYGPVSYFKVPLFINASDVCLIPLKSERNKYIGVSPIKMYEYLACGKPVVVTKVPGVEILERYDIGKLSKFDSNDFAEKISYYLNLSEEEYMAIRKKSRKLIVSEYSWDIAFYKVLNAILRTLKSKLDYYTTHSK